ncbi:MAG TPA: PAS domain-containing protein [Mycobacterium sp.]|nr:PAS domain-containing protein [Mycobacterium sp.]
MAHDWLLVETLGDEPAVVAQERHLKKLVPIAQFLRRSPHLAAIQTAIAESVQTGQSLASITPKNDRVIRTEPVQMSDGRVHGVHVWSGPADAEPPERPIPGPLKWDLTLGVATETLESLANSGKNPEVEATDGRAFAEELPTRDFNPNESKVLALLIRAEPGQTICSSWDITDWQGNPIRVGFVARNALEAGPDGREHLVSRGMNWRGQLDGTVQPPDLLAQQILQGLAQPGIHRALVDLSDWRLLKWLDEPCPFFDWHGTADVPLVHPDDEPLIDRMTTKFATGPATEILRLRGEGGGWVPVHVTVNRVELEEGTFAGLVALRLPADGELTDSGPSETSDNR